MTTYDFIKRALDVTSQSDVDNQAKVFALKQVRICLELAGMQGVEAVSQDEFVELYVLIGKEIKNIR